MVPKQQWLAQTQAQRAELILVAPVWEYQPMVSGLTMLLDLPVLIPEWTDIILPTHEQSVPEATPQLAVWPISGNTGKATIFCKMLQSFSSLWREKSSKTCNSLFHKWVSWCDRWSFDPISGPISEVVNFLAYLFSKGYQYRSLNTYTSPIS